MHYIITNLSPNNVANKTKRCLNYNRELSISVYRLWRNCVTVFPFGSTIRECSNYNIFIFPERIKSAIFKTTPSFLKLHIRPLRVSYPIGCRNFWKTLVWLGTDTRSISLIISSSSVISCHPASIYGTFSRLWLLIFSASVESPYWIHCCTNSAKSCVITVVRCDILSLGDM